jgi:hypothetical protein
MDVELQILKHLRRDAHPTVGIIDEYCEEYRDLFKEVTRCATKTTVTQGARTATVQGYGDSANDRLYELAACG